MARTDDGLSPEGPGLHTPRPSTLRRLARWLRSRRDATGRGGI